MMFFLILLIAIPAPAFAGEEVKSVDYDLKTIIGATLKGSEKPASERDLCGMPCGKGLPDQNKDCGDDLTVSELENKILPSTKDVVNMIEGKHFDLKKNLKLKRIAIFRKREGSKPAIAFDFKDGRFVGRTLLIAEDEDKKFVREYRELERIYAELKFKELCQYLSANNGKYLALIKKFSE